MTEIKKYGTTKEEEHAKTLKKCREIVYEIMNFGVSQAEILQIISLLSLELENREHMQQLSTMVKRFQENDTSKSTLITTI